MRALIFVLVAWIDLRAAMMLPDGTKKAQAEQLAATPLPNSPLDVSERTGLMIRPAHYARPDVRADLPLRSGGSPRALRRSAQLATGWNGAVDDRPGSDGPGGPIGLPFDNGPAARRFSGSAWFLSRTDGGGAGLANGGQLGGSQAGIRLFYQTGIPFLALTARASTPLASRLGREATVGIALRKRGMGLILEERLAIDKGGRTAPSVTAYGGVSDIALGEKFRLDGYIQGGVVGLRHSAGFVDGAVRVERTLIESGPSRLSGGLAVSGGAQPGVRRIDVGPQMVAKVPVGGTPLRVSAEWRQRIAGKANPGSGPAVTVGVDF